MMKAIVWEPSGYWVIAKRVAQGRFQVFDQAGDHDHRFELSSSDLALLLEGIDLRGAKRQRAKEDVQRLLSS